MPNEYVFESIRLTDNIRLRDSQLVQGQVRQEAILIFLKEYHRLLEEVTRDTDDPPGCHSMFLEIDGKTFIKQQDSEEGIKTFREYRKALKTVRAKSELFYPGARTLLAWKNGFPVGGVVLYIPKILKKRQDGVLEFAAHIGPFMVDQQLSSQFMLYMLENEVTAVHAERPKEVTPLTVQLTEWQFPTGKNANRWRSDSALAQKLNTDLSTQREDFATDEGVTYRTKLRRRQSL